MKLTQKNQINASKSGMTLLELTVVILVLLSLISILFIGARAWKRGSDRAASILTIRNVQQAVRSYANMNALSPGATVTGLRAEIFGDNKFMKNDPAATGAVHPAGTGTSFAITAPTIIPAVGTLYMTVTGTDATYYTPSEYSDW